MEAAARLRPEAVLLDIGLPQMDGYEVARRLRRMPDLTAMRLIALTGYGQTEDKRQAREVGFNNHLVKPIDLDEMKRALANDR